MAPEGQWVFMATGRSPTNIAVVKYWGKRDEALILPVNDSISVTLDPGHLSATTTVAVSPSFPSDRMWLNGKVSTNSVSLTNLHSRRLLGLFNDSRERELPPLFDFFSMIHSWLLPRDHTNLRNWSVLEELPFFVPMLVLLELLVLS
jgi:hypothetical protein